MNILNQCVGNAHLSKAMSFIYSKLIRGINPKYSRIMCHIMINKNSKFLVDIFKTVGLIGYIKVFTSDNNENIAVTIA